MIGKIASSPMITSVDEIQQFLKALPPIPMQPLCMGSPFLQSACIEGREDGDDREGDVILTVSATQKFPREDRHLKFLDVQDIFEVCAVAAYPTVALYPVSLRKACGEELRRQLLYHNTLHSLLPRARKAEVLSYVENMNPRHRSEELDILCAEWFGKILDRKITYTAISVPRKALRVPMI